MPQLDIKRKIDLANHIIDLAATQKVVLDSSQGYEILNNIFKKYGDNVKITEGILKSGIIEYLFNFYLGR